MQRQIKITLILLFFIAISKGALAQVYLGGSGVISQFSPSGLDEYRGFSAILQRQIYLKDSRFSLTPTLQGSWLTNRQYGDSFSEFYTAVAAGTHLNYDVLSSDKFKITPFAGPAFIWVTGTDAGILALEPRPVNFYRMGLDVGMSFTYIHSEHFSVKFIPFSFIWSNQEYRQGNMLCLLFQIK